MTARSISNPLLFAAFSAAMLGSVACGAAPANSLTDGAEVGLDGQGVQVGATESALSDDDFAALVKDQAYRTSGAFAQVTDKPSASQAAPDKMITVWVSVGNVDEYLMIDPSKTGSDASFRPGAVVIREVRDASGTLDEITAMTKGAPGNNPDVGDWRFLVADPNGVVQASTDGSQMVGAMPQCHGCHIPRSDDGFLFGVPAANKT